MATRGRPVNDLTGKTYNRLYVKGCAGQHDDGSYMWNCVCKCGNEKTVQGYLLVRGSVQSCGCLKQENARKFWYGNAHKREG